MEKSLFVETSVSFLSINEDGVGLMHFKEGVTIDIQEQMEHLEGIIQVCRNLPSPFVVTAGEFVTFTKEAKENAAFLEERSPVNAFAIVVSNLANKLVASLYIRLQKPKIPYKIFSNKEKAIDWCKQFVTPTMQK